MPTMTAVARTTLNCMITLNILLLSLVFIFSTKYFLQMGIRPSRKRDTRFKQLVLQEWPVRPLLLTYNPVSPQGLPFLRFFPPLCHYHQNPGEQKTA